MKMTGRRGRLLGVRPGPLANFSSGAGYMPFVMFLSVPASVLYSIVSLLLLSLVGRRALRGPAPADYTVTRTPLHELVRYIRVHLLVCGVLTIGCGVFFFEMGHGMLKSTEASYLVATFLIAAGPLVASFLSTVVLSWLIIRRGSRWVHSLYAVIVNVALLLAFLFAGIFLT